MLQRSVTLIRRFVCTRPKPSIKWSECHGGQLGSLSSVMLLSLSRCARSSPGWTHSLVPSAQFSFFQIGTTSFERVDQPLAGLEGGVAMRRADGDRHAGLAQRHVAQAMHDRAVDERPAAAGLGFQLGQLRSRPFRG